MHKYIGRVFNADTGECVELLTVMATGFNHARRLVLENIETETGEASAERNEFIDVKKFHEPGDSLRHIKAPQYGV